MKICVVGFGSIGKRHVKNIIAIFRQRNMAIQIDLLRSGRGKEDLQEYEKIIHNVFYHCEDMDKDYDVIFITNPTSLHYKTLQQLKHYATHFFIEKPVFSDAHVDLVPLSDLINAERICYVAAPLRYTKVIQYLKRHIIFEQVYSVRVICSSYLPEWRKDTNYRKTYSAKAALGGGVDIDLIHEWDYLYYLLGKPLTVYNIKGKYSELETDSNDISIYIAKYKDKLVELHLDYFGRVPERTIRLYLKDEVIEADLYKSQIQFKVKNRCIKFGEERNQYQIKELEYFFKLLEGAQFCDNTLETALDILKITKGEME